MMRRLLDERSFKLRPLGLIPEVRNGMVREEEKSVSQSLGGGNAKVRVC